MLSIRIETHQQRPRAWSREFWTLDEGKDSLSRGQARLPLVVLASSYHLGQKFREFFHKFLYSWLARFFHFLKFG